MTDNTNLNEESKMINEVEEAPCEAEAPETVTEDQPVRPDKKGRETSAGFLLRLVGTLTAVCVAVAMLLAVVNGVTKNKIAENVTRAKKEAVLSIFKNGKDCELYNVLEDGSEVYLVYRDNGVVGYCAFISVNGFGGEISMMVGIDSTYATEGVKIVSMSETPGVGSKVDSADFLSLFNGMPHGDPIGAVDSIAGATISSNAVKAGVLAAHSIEIDLSAVCTEKGLELITSDMLETETDGVTEEVPSAPSDSSDVTEPAETDAPETEPVSPDTDVAETDPPETEDISFVDNPGAHHVNNKFNNKIDASSGSDRFVIEIPKDDETATFETTAEPETTPEPIVTEDPAPIVTEAPVVTDPPVTVPPVTEAPVVTDPPVTAPPVSEAPVVTDPPVTEPPVTEAETTEDPNEIPPWLDTQPEETLPSWLDTQPEETVPSWLDTQPEETMPSWIGG